MPKKIPISSGREFLPDVQLEDLLGEYSIEIPGNGISQTGIDAVQEILAIAHGRQIPNTITLPNGKPYIWKWDWKVGGRAEYVGTLPKRIAKYFQQSLEIKLSPFTLTALGNIGAAHSGKQETFYYDIVDHVEWNKTDFGQPDECCFWGCHASAKQMILDNGGGAIRFFTHNTPLKKINGFARAWLAPFQNCWIVFNGYGLSALAIARILATHLKHSYYKQIDLFNQGSGDGTLWINSNNQRGNSSGYLVGPQETVLKHTSIDLEWDPHELFCTYCEDSLGLEHSHTPAGGDCCEECWDERYFVCVACDETYPEDSAYSTPEEEQVCPGCFSRGYFMCDVCREACKKDSAHKKAGMTYCHQCWERTATDSYRTTEVL